MNSETRARIPLGVALPIAEDLAEQLEPYAVKLEVAGSIRRRKATVKDIEIVAVPRFEEHVGPSEMELFGAIPPERETVNVLWRRIDDMIPTEQRIKWGKRYRQFRFEAREGHTITVDLFTGSVASWGWNLLVRTGSAEFSHHVARELNRRGFTSKDFMVYRKDRGGKPEGESVPTLEEADVFRLAGMGFLKPEKRSWE